MAVPFPLRGRGGDLYISKTVAWMRREFVRIWVSCLLSIWWCFVGHQTMLCEMLVTYCGILVMVCRIREMVCGILRMFSLEYWWWCVECWWSFMENRLRLSGIWTIFCRFSADSLQDSVNLIWRIRAYLQEYCQHAATARTMPILISINKSIGGHSGWRAI